jgi:hypothetical protein
LGAAATILEEWMTVCQRLVAIRNCSILLELAAAKGITTVVQIELL